MLFVSVSSHCHWDPLRSLIYLNQSNTDPFPAGASVPLPELHPTLPDLYLTLTYLILPYLFLGLAPFGSLLFTLGCQGSHVLPRTLQEVPLGSEATRCAPV